MQSQVRLGRIFGVDVGLHYTWFLIAVLITLSLAGHFRAGHPSWDDATVWITAVVTGILFFISIILHELSHALVARARQVPVHGITLFALGGVAHIRKEPASASTEFFMGIVGPAVSLLIGGLCLTLGGALRAGAVFAESSPIQAVLLWLGVINVTLGLFNLLPAFPLDGGRVLRAILWWRTGSQPRSTRIAARIGQVFGFAMILFGFLRFFTGGGFSGLWMAFIGWFLLEAARSSQQQVEIVERLRDVRVGDVMAQDCPTVDGRTDLETFVSDHLLRTGRRCWMVEEDGRMVGILTPHEIKAVPRDRWAQTPVERAMRPLDQLSMVRPETPLVEALETMQNEDVNQLPVLSNGRLLGVLSRGHVLQVLQARAELPM